MNTIPQELKTRWLEALRSGKFKQGFGQLEDEVGFCCLGVLQVVVDGKVEREDGDNALALPSPEWCRRHRFSLDANSIPVTDPELPSLGKVVNNPYRFVTCAHANDSMRLTFTQIADAIEVDFEGV